MADISLLYNKFLAHPIISTDTRSIEKGSLFFALKGDQFDANQYAIEALEKGAAFAIIDDVNVVGDDRLIYVESTLKTLQELAAYHRSQFAIPFIAITGSNGKTTTKELMNSVLSEKFNVLATKGNFNNHIGVPLTLLRLTREHQLAIIEMGANHQGEIAFLCGIANPDIGIITNIGKAHLKGFGSYEGVKIAKTELYKFIGAKGGTLFVNGLDNVLMEESAPYKRVLYSVNSNASISEEGKIELILKSSELEKLVKTQLFGLYNIPNIFCAVSLGEFFEVPFHNICQALEKYKPKNNRSQVIKTSGNTIILDAYNANPTSMRVAIESFSRLDGKNKILILGDMMELGEEEINEHLSLLDFLNQFKFKNVFLVGHIFNNLLQTKYPSFVDVSEFNKHLDSMNIEGFQIFVKGSRSIQLERVMDFIP